jgi:3-methylfumaryl-CoA hydratase
MQKGNVSVAPVGEWLGKEQAMEEQIVPFPLSAMAATLDRPMPDAVPPLWHWLYFLPVAPMSEVGLDGHLQRGGFLPPVALPRRMWAGSRLRFHAPLPVGGRALRRSVIERIDHKEGRTGPLVFVTVRHRIESAGVLCIEEMQDIVYRDHPSPGAAGKVSSVAPDGEVWSRTVTADPVLLFRYSALTFNGHRIHYDEPYATKEEGYPGLIVHGPLIATLLMDLVERHARQQSVLGFEFRAVNPTFANTPFTLCGLPSGDGTTVDLWVRDHGGSLAVRATATLSK